MTKSPKIALLASCALFLAVATPAMAAEDLTSPEGFWKTIPDNKGDPGIVKVTLKDGKLTAQVVKVLSEAHPNPRCIKCEGALKDAPIIGIKLVENLSPVEKDVWGDGQVLDPDSGKFYKVKISLIDGGKRIKLRGYIGAPAFGRTQYWERTTAP
jgi:uncharacterized protein (DUF2147 family)